MFSDIYYPEGNVERNQLQDSSISLSPQRTNSRNKLQLRKTTNLHQNFLRLQTFSSVAHHLSGPNIHAFMNKLGKKLTIPGKLSLRNFVIEYGFPKPLYLFNTQFAYMIDSLIRVSRRFDKST